MPSSTERSSNSDNSDRKYIGRQGNYTGIRNTHSTEEDKFGYKNYSDNGYEQKLKYFNISKQSSNKEYSRYTDESEISDEEYISDNSNEMEYFHGYTKHYRRESNMEVTGYNKDSYLHMLEEDPYQMDLPSSFGNVNRKKGFSAYRQSPNFQPEGPRYFNEHANTFYKSTNRQVKSRNVKAEYIELKSRRTVTFSKRKKGLLKKAYEIGKMTGAEVSVILTNESGNIFSYATENLKPLTKHYEKFIQVYLKQISHEDANKFDSEAMISYDNEMHGGEMGKEYVDKYNTGTKKEHPSDNRKYKEDLNTAKYPSAQYPKGHYHP